MEPEKEPGRWATHEIPDLNELTHIKTNLGEEHDTTTFLDHTTECSTKEERAIFSDRSKTFNKMGSPFEATNREHDFDNKHSVLHPRGSAGTSHDKIKADEVDPKDGRESPRNFKHKGNTHTHDLERDLPTTVTKVSGHLPNIDKKSETDVLH